MHSHVIVPIRQAQVYPEFPGKAFAHCPVARNGAGSDADAIHWSLRISHHSCFIGKLRWQCMPISGDGTASKDFNRNAG